MEHDKFPAVTSGAADAVALAVRISWIFFFFFCG